MPKPKRHSPSSENVATQFLPDWLCPPPADRPALNLLQFAQSLTSSSPLALPPSLSNPDPSTHSDRPSSQTIQCPDNPSSTILPSAAIQLASLQPSPIGPFARVPPSPRAPLTLDEILASVDNAEPVEVREEELGAGVCVEVAVYDSEEPTMSARFRFPVCSVLTELIDVVPCTLAKVERRETDSQSGAGLIYIEGVLYEDRRSSQVDLASNVVQFLKSRDVDVAVVDLTQTKTRFLDLSVRLGTPYVFVHMGGCEHLIMFSDVYKLYDGYRGKKELWRRAPRVTRCDVCAVHYAEKFTMGDVTGDRSPFHFCQRCFQVAHYAKSGELLADAKNLTFYSHPSLS